MTNKSVKNALETKEEEKYLWSALDIQNRTWMLKGLVGAVNKI
jgi:hypothetical protein